MTDVRRRELKGAFREAGLTKVDDEILSQCVALSTSTRLSAQQMKLCWEAFSLNRNVRSLDTHTLDSFRAAVLKHAERHGNVEAIVSRPAHKRTSPSKDESSLGRLPSVTPPAKKSRDQHHSPNNNSNSSASPSPGSSSSLPPSSSSSSSSAPSYDDRTRSGEVIQRYQPSQWTSSTTTSTTTTSRCRIVTDGFSSNVAQTYRHWNTTAREKARHLDRHLQRLADIIRDQWGIGPDDKDDDDDNHAPTNSPKQQKHRQQGNNTVAALGTVGVPRQDPVCCLGRICNEAHEGKLNRTTLLLEGSAGEAGGARIRLDVSRLESTSFSLFPGQIVAVEGLHTTPHRLVAHRLCEGVPPPVVTTPADELLRYHHEETVQDGTGLKIMAVAGPYCTTDNLAYTPLYDFLHKVMQEKADVAILMGPFVDLRHPTVRTGRTTIPSEDGKDIPVSLESFFAENITAALAEFMENETVTTQFVLVPSLEDATASWVFPQPPLHDRLPQKVVEKASLLPGCPAGLPMGTMDLASIARGRQQQKRVHCVSNPCTLRINELVVGLTSADILGDLSPELVNGNVPGRDRLTRMAQHLLHQQSYYPLFPSGTSTNLDLAHLEQCQIPCRPDLLLTPSKLTPFVRPVLETSLVVNPGTLTKGSSGGTYTFIQVEPLPRSALEDVDGAVELPHGILNRAMVEVRRI